LKPSEPATYEALVASRRDQLRIQIPRLLSSPVPFVWEIGSGHGHFLTAFAAAHPEVQCIGIDISLDRVARAKRKQERAGLGNLHFILADAADFLAALPAGARLGAVFILFPDPWPKRRHHKNRLLKPELLSAVAAVAGSGAPLYLRTDHEQYFREAEATVAAHEAWTRSPGTLLPFEEPTVFQRRAPRHFTLVATRR
jgi:tRNA (guanine-N7-)-methyltransferase